MGPLAARDALGALPASNPDALEAKAATRPAGAGGRGSNYQAFGGV